LQFSDRNTQEVVTTDASLRGRSEGPQRWSCSQDPPAHQNCGYGSPPVLARHGVNRAEVSKITYHRYL